MTTDMFRIQVQGSRCLEHLPNTSIRQTKHAYLYIYIYIHTRHAPDTYKAPTADPDQNQNKGRQQGPIGKPLEPQETVGAACRRFGLLQTWGLKLWFSRLPVGIL